MSQVSSLFGDVTEEEGTLAPEEQHQGDEEQHEQEQQAEQQTEEAGEQQTEQREEEEIERKQVPLDALHEERARRRELQGEVQKQRELMARMEERFKAIQERVAKPEAEPEPGPSFEEDPAAFLRHQNEQLAKRLEGVETERKQQGEQAQQAQAMQEFQQRFLAIETEFAGKTPDYYEAIEHLRQSRAEELRAYGYQPEQIQQALVYEAHQLAGNAINAGHNPAEVFYANAKLRGYRANPVPKQESDTKLKQIAEGQQRASSMGPSGDSSSGSLTLAQLAELSDHEFEKATEGDNWRRLHTQ